MITVETIEQCKRFIADAWKEDGKKVVAECAKVEPFNGTFKQFLDHCTTCGGDWGGMLLTGINKLYPNVWDAIPEQMGTFAFAAITNVLVLCGVDTSEEED